MAEAANEVRKGHMGRAQGSLACAMYGKSVGRERRIRQQLAAHWKEGCVATD